MHRISLIAATLAAVWSGNAQAECLARHLTYGADEKMASSSPEGVLIEIPLDEVSTYVAAGYAPASCKVAPQSKIAKMDVCGMARFGNDAVQARFAELLGTEPSRLCRSAQKFEGKTTDTQAPN